MGEIRPSKPKKTNSEKGDKNNVTTLNSKGHQKTGGRERQSKAPNSFELSNVWKISEVILPELREFSQENQRQFKTTKEDRFTMYYSFVHKGASESCETDDCYLQEGER